MKTISLALCLVCLLLLGCGNPVSGTYVAEVEQLGPATHPDPGYSLTAYQQKLADQPRVIELKPHGRFLTREGNRVVWEGSWRREADTLILRAETVYGIVVQEKLRHDVRYGFREGRIYDEGMVKPYGLRLVYRKP